MPASQPASQPVITNPDFKIHYVAAQRTDKAGEEEEEERVRVEDKGKEEGEKRGDTWEGGRKRRRRIIGETRERGGQGELEEDYRKKR